MDGLFWKLQRGLLPLWRWLLPGLFVLACWLLLLCPSKVLAFVPSTQFPWLLGGPFAQHKTATLPSSRSAVYQLGYIAGKLKSQEADLSSLDTAATLLSLPKGAVTAEVMASLGQAFSVMDHDGIGTRFSGLFSFINFIWCCSIISIAISATPVLLILAKPLKRFLRTHARRFINALLCCASALQPAFQAVLFWLCFYIIAAAAHYPTSYNPLIALSGCIMSAPVFFWTFMPHAAVEAEPEMVFCKTFLLLVLTPVTIVYDSVLIGLFSSIALFGALGLSGVPYGLGWDANFANSRDFYRFAGIGSLILSGTATARVVGVDSAVLWPLQAGIFVFGSIWLFIACLIETTFLCTTNANTNVFLLVVNLRFLIVLLLSVLAGASFHLASLQNTGIIFTLVWVMVRILELSMKGRCTWIGVFCMSVMSWQLALWLHSHPDFVQALFWRIGQNELHKVEPFPGMYV